MIAFEEPLEDASPRLMSCATQYHGLFGLVLRLLFCVAMEAGRSVGQLTGWTACRFVGCLCCFRENITCSRDDASPSRWGSRDFPAVGKEAPHLPLGEAKIEGVTPELT